MGRSRLALLVLGAFQRNRVHVQRLGRVCESAARSLYRLHELEQDLVPDLEKLDPARGLKPGLDVDIERGLADLYEMDVDQIGPDLFVRAQNSDEGLADLPELR